MHIKINVTELDVARVMTIGKALGGHFIMDDNNDLRLVQDEPLSKAIDNLTAAMKPAYASARAATFKEFEALKVTA